MPSARWAPGLAGVLLLFVGVVGGGEGDPGQTPSEPKMPRVEGVRSGTEDSRNLLLVSPKEYQDLLDENARLKAQLKGERADAPAEAPSSCKISGEVLADNAHLRLEYELRTTVPRARIALGCSLGRLSKAERDGHPALIQSGTDRRLFAVIEEPGDHRLILELDLPLVTREGKFGERGFDLDLPGAAVTLLEGVTLPSGVREARLARGTREGTGREEVVTSLTADAQGRIRTPGLGPIDRLDLSWEDRLPAQGAAPLPRLETSRIEVTVDARTVTTRAEMTLGVRLSGTKQWQILVPPQARLILPQGDPRKPIAVVEPVEPKGYLRTISIAEPTRDPLSIIVETQHPRGGAPVPIGPFAVVGALRQRGDLILFAPADVALTPTPTATPLYNVAPRDLTESEKRRAPTVQAFTYRIPTAPGKAALPAFLDLDADRTRGVLEATRVSHTLRLGSPENGTATWHLTTSMTFQAYHSEVESVVLAFPPGYVLDERFGLAPAGEFQISDRVDRQRRHLTVLLTPRRKGPFTLTFEGRYTPPEGHNHQGIFSFPTPISPSERGPTDPLGPVDRGAQVTVLVPDDLEILSPRGSEPGTREAHNRRTWTLRRSSDHLDLVWQPHRPDLAVEGRVAITISGRQATVKHELWLASTPATTSPLILRVPGEVQHLAALGTDRPPLEPRPGGRAVALSSLQDREKPLILEYAFRLPEDPEAPFRVPLVVPEQATRGEVRVLLTADAGVGIESLEDRWEQRHEEVRGAIRYPSLVLLSRRPDLSLTIRLLRGGGEALTAWTMERALAQVVVADSGQQSYRVRYILKQVASATLDMEVPTPPAGNLRVRYRDHEAPWQALDESGRATNSGRRLVRVTLEPAVVGGILDVSYTLTPGRASGSSALQSILQPPIVRGDAGVAPLRWQVSLPGGWVALTQDGTGGDLHWVRRGWLLAPRPSTGPADLERWLLGSDTQRAEDTDSNWPTVLCWTTPGTPLLLTHAPHQPWLLLCSLGILLVGLGLGFLSLPRLLVLGILVLLGGSAVVLGFLAPGFLAAFAYGVQPGAAVLFPLLALQWILQQRYRRQLLFLPGFARNRAGTPGSRSGIGPRPRGEPSTVDHQGPPPRSHSSLRQPTAEASASSSEENGGARS